MVGTSSSIELEDADIAIVNGFQGGFPVVKAPFEPASQELREHGVDLTPTEFVNRLRELNRDGVISRFGPLINADEIGGTATLVAMKVPEESFEEVSRTVNSFDEVAHNYERDHELNMWFVVSVADPGRVDEVLNEIRNETGLETYEFPKLTEFEVGAEFRIDGPLKNTDVDLSHLGLDNEGEQVSSDEGGLREYEKEVLLQIQDGFPYTTTPYEEIAGMVSTDTDGVLRTIEKFLHEGKIRRIGVIPNHYALGYTFNAMIVGNIPDDIVDSVGTEVASLSFVTHCYERPRHEGVWEYNLFAMVHGRTEEEADERISEVLDTISSCVELEGDDWDTLYSTRILKKTGIRIEERIDVN